MSSTTLLRGGTLLIHNNENHVVPTKADLLIEGDVIVDIQPSISPPSTTTRVLECAGKIISPGFIDTHHHLWQTQLRGTHANETLLEYFYTGNFVSSKYTPSDIFWGQLSGALECIDAGTTTVVDHASLNCSAAHSEEAIRATIASGLRSIFCYCPTPRVAQWLPTFELEQNLLPDWVMSTFDRLSSRQPFGPNGRVRLGFAFDGLFLPGTVLKELFAKVRRQGVQLITTHALQNALFGQGPSAATVYDSHQLLGPDLLFSHATGYTPDDAALLLKSGASVSSTPSTEIQMGHGDPVCLSEDLSERSSLGIDCHSACSAYLPAQMMLVLQYARGLRHQKFQTQGKAAKSVGPSVEDVYNLGTIKGARAVGMEKELGSLEVGKKADIVVFEGSSPGMLGAAERDPVAAVVLHSSVRDVATVIVDGMVRKENGQLVEISVPKDISPQSGDATQDRIVWADVVRAVDKSREEIQVRMKDTDKDVARKGVIKNFYLDEAAILDNL